jgi:hypothetical protein
MDFYDTFQQMIAEYNTGATNADALFAQLVDFAKQLNEEERRGIREQLDDEQLAIFDILTRPSPNLPAQPDFPRFRINIPQDDHPVVTARGQGLAVRPEGYASHLVGVAGEGFAQALVPPGEHRVTFAFEPVTWRVGLAISALTLAGLIGYGAIAWRRRRAARKQNYSE